MINDLKTFLDEKVDQYNRPEFVESDPMQIPNRYHLLQDIEISAFFSATIAWGKRNSIIKSAEKIIDIMSNAPYDFIMNFTEADLKSLVGKSIHRTFNGEDFAEFCRNLKRIYKNHNTLEDLFLLKDNETNFYHALHRFRTEFLANPEHRSGKHISSTYKNSAAKRLMMFLRWLVRKDQRKVDLGLWERLSPRYLSIPLDVHTSNISRKLGLITRKQNDWKAVEELDFTLRQFDSEDPAKYDFALFGLGLSGDLDFE